MVIVEMSDVGAGAVLLQKDTNGVGQPVSFYSKLKYSVIEKETHALIWALQHFDVYVGSSVPLAGCTDHNPLTFLYSVHCPKPQVDATDGVFAVVLPGHPPHQRLRER